MKQLTQANMLYGTADHTGMLSTFPSSTYIEYLMLINTHLLHPPSLTMCLWLRGKSMFPRPVPTN